MNPFTKHLTLTAVFIALGLLVPMVFHAMGLGSTFLPMFWPVATGAFFLPLLYAVILGLLTPFLSALLTGMPPLSPPIAYMMMAELIAMNLTITLLHENTRLGPFVTLLISLLVSRGVLMIFVYLLAPLLGLPAKWFSLAIVLRGVPGMIGMLIFLPPLVSRIKKENLFLRR